MTMPEDAEPAIINAEKFGLDHHAQVTLGNAPEIQDRGAFVTCKNLEYSVKSSKFRSKWISIVQNVSFYLAPRDLTAVIGPSGCGKRLF